MAIKNLTIIATALFTSVAAPVTAQDFFSGGTFSSNPFSMNPSQVLLNPLNLNHQIIMGGLMEAANGATPTQNSFMNLKAITDEMPANPTEEVIAEMQMTNLVMAVTNPYIPVDALANFGISEEFTPYISKCREEQLTVEKSVVQMADEIASCAYKQQKLASLQIPEEKQTLAQKFADLTDEELTRVHISCFKKQEDGNVIINPENRVRASGQDAINMFQNDSEYRCNVLMGLPKRHGYSLRR